MPPPYTVPSIIQKLIGVYVVWHEYFIRLDKINRYSLGLKINTLFLEVLDLFFIASRKNPEQKGFYLNKALDSLDLLKFTLQLSWEIEVLNTQKYSVLSIPLDEVGKMLGGWIRKTRCSEGCALASPRISVERPAPLFFRKEGLGGQERVTLFFRIHKSLRPNRDSRKRRRGEEVGFGGAYRPINNLTF